MLRLCELNGGTYIKVGQHLGALDYLIPSEYVSTMRVLHNHCPQTDYKDVLSVIREDLGCEVMNHWIQLYWALKFIWFFILFMFQPSEVFQSIEETPLGSASLAQVHKAKLLDGSTVAVKVQHPLVKSYSQVDLKSMEVRDSKHLIYATKIWEKCTFDQVLFRMVSWFFPEFKLMWLLDETKLNLPCELNFTMEGQNAEKTAKLLKHLSWLHVSYTEPSCRLSWNWSYYAGPKNSLELDHTASTDNGILRRSRRGWTLPNKRSSPAKDEKGYFEKDYPALLGNDFLAWLHSLWPSSG